MSGLNFKTPCFAYRGGRNVPFCFTVVFAIVLHRFRSRSIPLHMSPFQRCIFSEFFLSEVLSASLAKTNRRVCTLSWNHGQEGRQKTYLVWCGYPLSNLTASVFSKLLLPFLTIMRAAARNGSKGFFKCSSDRLFMGGYFIIIIITKLIALQGFNLRDSKGNERSIALLMIPLSCLC